MSAFVLLLSGPSGAGKTATAERWAASQPVPTAFVSHDHVRTFVRAGYANPEQWSEEAGRQWELAIRVCAGMAREYVDAGVRCVVEAWRPPQEDDTWDALLAGVDVRSVILMPSLEVARQRNGTRESHEVGEEAHARNYADFEWCVQEFTPSMVIDNSFLSVDECVAAIDRLMAGEVRSP